MTPFGGVEISAARARCGFDGLDLRQDTALGAGVEAVGRELEPRDDAARPCWPSQRGQPAQRRVVVDRA